MHSPQTLLVERFRVVEHASFVPLLGDPSSPIVVAARTMSLLSSSKQVESQTERKKQALSVTRACLLKSDAAVAAAARVTRLQLGLDSAHAALLRHELRPDRLSLYR